ncbi:conserved Plasmodium protein, unknown function [Plasmodium relictum]|uniref:Uncharacterized protein n=1 Tax=Plasmodium relictum TaxID=85471 RepID=A0A1J1HAS1_PLARL|nr:conserved Plasmodium protein, unknown function [Plasmodium relictum]CRH02577.1 conserved Plasmodium protein, unknown function [Plasmodium relictum]
MFFLNSAFSYKKNRSIKYLNGSSDSFRRIKHTNFHELRTNDIRKENQEKLSVDVKDDVIYISSNILVSDEKKIRGMVIFTKSYPKELLEKLKEFLKEYVKDSKKLLTIEKL